MAKNSGDRAVAAIPPKEQTQNTFPTLDFSPYFQSTRPEFEESDHPSATPPVGNPPQDPDSNLIRPELDRPNSAIRRTNINRGNFSLLGTKRVAPDKLEVQLVNSEGCRVNKVFKILDRERIFQESIQFIAPNGTNCGGVSYSYQLQPNGKQLDIQTSLGEKFVVLEEGVLIKIHYETSSGEKGELRLDSRNISHLPSDIWASLSLHLRQENQKKFFLEKNINFVVAKEPIRIDRNFLDLKEPSDSQKIYNELQEMGGPAEALLPVVKGLCQAAEDTENLSLQAAEIAEVKIWNLAKKASALLSSRNIPEAAKNLKSLNSGLKNFLKPSVTSGLDCDKFDEKPDEGNTAEQPPSEPSPEQPNRNSNNRKPQPVAPPSPLQPGECLCKWSMNTNRAITRNGVPMVETYDYVTGCDRSAEEVRELFRRQGFGTSLPDGIRVNGQTVGEVHKVTMPGDIPGNGCKKDPPQPPPQSILDPHLRTFDGLKYDHHAVGEFILTKSTDGAFEVQVREAAVPGKQVALNSAVAMKVGSNRVAFYAKDFPDSDTSNPLRVDGKPTVIQGGSLSLPGGGTIIKENQRGYIVQWSTGERVAVEIQPFGGSASGLLNIIPDAPQTRQGQLIGLLGNFNGNQDDDLKSRDGKVLPPQSSINQVNQITQNISKFVPIPLNQIESAFLEQLHKQFGDSWRVSQTESLFDYAPGKNTESFTNRAFPNGFQVLRALLPAQVQAAEATCRQAGVASDRLEECIFDVGATGNADFAKAAANALTNVVRDRIQNEIQQRSPIPVPVKIPGIRF